MLSGAALRRTEGRATLVSTGNDRLVTERAPKYAKAQPSANLTGFLSKSWPNSSQVTSNLRVSSLQQLSSSETLALHTSGSEASLII